VDHHLNDDSEARLVIAETDPAGVAMLYGRCVDDEATRTRLDHLAVTYLARSGVERDPVAGATG